MSQSPAQPSKAILALLLATVLAQSAVGAVGGLEPRPDDASFARRRTERIRLLPRPPTPPKTTQPVFNVIDQFIGAAWDSSPSKETPSLCDDATFLRRVYLDLIGLIPTPEAARKFVDDRDPKKRDRLVDELLARRLDYAAHWTTFWEDALASAPVESISGVNTHGQYRHWLRTSFAENKPYDRMVSELLDPTTFGHKNFGLKEGAEKQRTFILNSNDVESAQSAANVAQVFLGTGMKCAACHNHFLNNEWPQKRFLGFASFFSGHDLELVRCEQHSGTRVPAQFPFSTPGVSAGAPAGVDQRLHRVSDLLIDPLNPRFSKALVNRLWKRYFGLGLVEPVDDFREDRPASHPQLLDWLADDFVRNNFDFQHTIRLVLTSRAYQLKYDPAREDVFDLERPGQPRYFRSPSLRRLSAEQWLDSVNFATRLKGRKRIYLDNYAPVLSQALGRPASRQEVMTTRPEDPAVLQALELMNGPELRTLISAGDVPARLAAGSAESQVAEIYWIVLSRAPSEREIEEGQKFLRKSGGGVDAITDFLWALFVSPDFQYIR